jgi:hypothetical protein
VPRANRAFQELSAALQVGGDEDIPRGCVAVLCRQSIDVLCHAALRARSTGALVATCSDAEQLRAMAEDFDGQRVQLRLDASHGARILCTVHSGELAPENQQPQEATSSESQLRPAEVDLSSQRCAHSVSMCTVCPC